MTGAVMAFAAGLGLLLGAGHLVVRSASNLGLRLGLTPNVIGLTILAAGTSAPELAVVFQAVAADDAELAVGSVIGSNIANVLLVLGLAALMGAITVTSRLVRIDIPVMVVASGLLLVFALDGRLGRLEGLILVLGLVVFTAWTLRVTRSGGEPLSVGGRLPRHIAELLAGIILLAVAARLVVRGAEDIATSLGVPELIIGLTIVALGTSAPEIVTTLVAAARGQRDLAVGNAVGSNIYNILLVLGLAATATPAGIAVSNDAATLDLPIMTAAAFACLPLVAWDRRLARWEGAVFVSYYAAYLLFLVLDATGHRAKEPFALIMMAFVLPLTIITLATVIHRRHARWRAGLAPAGSPVDAPGGSPAGAHVPADPHEREEPRCPTSQPSSPKDRSLAGDVRDPARP
jgi:cation:H+ antiporter